MSTNDFEYMKEAMAADLAECTLLTVSKVVTL